MTNWRHRDKPSENHLGAIMHKMSNLDKWTLTFAFFVVFAALAVAALGVR